MVKIDAIDVNNLDIGLENAPLTITFQGLAKIKSDLKPVWAEDVMLSTTAKEQLLVPNLNKGVKLTSLATSAA